MSEISIKDLLPKLKMMKALALTFVVLATAASAQEKWPSRPVKLVVPLAAGGGVDLMARLFAERLSEQLGQRVFVENQGGGGGTLGMAAVARAEPDGYTLAFQSVSAAINPLVHKNLPYDGINGLKPVTLATTFPLVAIVPGSLPVKTLKEFITLLKDNPGKYSYGSSGVGGITHLAGEHFKRLAGVDIVHVPYRGNSGVITDLVAGRVELLFDGVAPAVGHIKSGSIRPLGVSAAQRSKILPDIPAIKEVLAGFEVPFWTAIFAPANTPKEIVQRIASETAIAARSPDTVRRLEVLGAEGVGSTSEEMETFWRQQLEYFGKIVRDANLAIGEDAPK